MLTLIREPEFKQRGEVLRVKPPKELDETVKQSVMNRFYRRFMEFETRVTKHQMICPPSTRSAFFGTGYREVWYETVWRTLDHFKAFVSDDELAVVAIISDDVDAFRYRTTKFMVASRKYNYRFILQLKIRVEIESALSRFSRFIVNKLPRKWRSRLSNKFKALAVYVLDIWFDPDNYLELTLNRTEIDTDDTGLGFVVENAKWAGVPGFPTSIKNTLEEYENEEYNRRVNFWSKPTGGREHYEERQFPRSVVDRVRRPRKNSSA